MRLDHYTTGTDYSCGASWLTQVLWFFGGSVLVQTHWIPFSAFKVWVLRRFGARIGRGVRIKPGVQVKFPWRLQVGDYSWLGENCWLDSNDNIAIGEHVCISQGVYLCTGNHDWSDPNFALRCAPITIGRSSWIGAQARVGPGVTVGEGAVLTLGGVATRSLNPHTIYAGNPAVPIKTRKITASPPKPEGSLAP
ncbi:WcaF family extracellular polysaccharide biosynthesis acetyltransferase [Lyngbya confervoides]|uniref:WcaF family extracellular polysaccharide biosynthesis acetyltransferase n=1 Tax=Lyngbya confervoides BDU141951 TaxID=1574623 RepID=A0ABD4SYS2_9CYAN|nr:WcaF family extracellular polysaccharide biosynthesis acetyltransferase [Lyngbya confervoides]MCM1981606.1 WcaF family extracellular polysaccharide biosynthesis acetyltransferase [Lyngbya confervoides BDU141951]